MSCEACRRGAPCEGTTRSAGRPTVAKPFPYRFQMRAARPAGLPSGGCIVPPVRPAGAIEPVTPRYTATDAEDGRIASIARALVALDQPRAAGDPPSREAVTDDATAARTFDPRDPASMTEARWREMSPDAQRAWIDANVRNEDQRRRMVESIANGVFGTIREFITSEREKRLTEIREAALTERERIRQQQDTERARITAETERLRIEAQRARDEAAVADREAQNAQNEAERLRRQAEADAARERAQQAQRDADAAAARRAEAEAAAERERRESRELDRPAGLLSTTAGKILAGILGAAAVGAVGYVAVKALAPPPPPPQLPAGYGYGAQGGR